jgi:hypothetical protein
VIDQAEFEVIPHFRTIECLASQALTLNTLRHLILDTIIPLYLSLDRDFVFHGSAVHNGDKSIAFLGESGVGKSTLAAYFCEQGWKLLSDDIVLIDQMENQHFVTPTYPSVRLWPESLEKLSGNHQSVEVSQFNSKQRVSLDFCPTSQKLSSIYLLNKKRSPGGKLVDLVSCSFILNTEEPEVEDHFARLGSLISNVPVSFLDYEQSDCGLRKVLERCNDI